MKKTTEKAETTLSAKTTKAAKALFIGAETAALKQGMVYSQLRAMIPEGWKTTAFVAACFGIPTDTKKEDMRKFPVSKVKDSAGKTRTVFDVYNNFAAYISQRKTAEKVETERQALAAKLFESGLSAEEVEKQVAESKPGKTAKPDSEKLAGFKWESILNFILANPGNIAAVLNAVPTPAIADAYDRRIVKPAAEKQARAAKRAAKKGDIPHSAESAVTH